MPPIFYEGSREIRVGPLNMEAFLYELQVFMKVWRALMICPEYTVTLVITLTNPSPPLPPPPYHSLGVLPSKTFIFQGNSYGHPTCERGAQY